MTREDLIDRIQKLLALSDSSNPNEAAIALSRAQKLMKEYNIENADLSKPVIDGFYVPTQKGLKSPKEISYLIHIIQNAFGVVCIMKKSSASTVSDVYIAGPEDTLKACEYVFVMLSRAALIAKKEYSTGAEAETVAFICLGDPIRKYLEEHNPSLLFTYDSIRDLVQKEQWYPDKARPARELLISSLKNDPNIENYIKKLNRSKKQNFILGFFSAIIDKVEKFAVDIAVKDEIDKKIAADLGKLGTYTRRNKGMNDAEYQAYNNGIEEGGKVNINSAISSSGVEQRKLSFRG